MNCREMTQYEIDDMYAQIAQAYEGLDASQSHFLNAAAVFLLSAHVNSEDLKKVLELARSTALKATS